ncbi:MAG TPA: hypothetical protein VF546_21620 [Pyrinomonadaceae bacterium]|jgi:hypothetical protein
METVLAAIREHKEAFARKPFFTFLQDDSLEPEQRLAFFPCMAHWIMSFADLNRYFLRADPSADPHQQRVNTYTHEDDDHWRLYLEDFEKLGCAERHDGTGWLSFLWGDATRANRMLSYRVAHLVMGASGVERLAIVEALKEAANVFFPLTLRLADQLQARTGVELRYLGHFHFNLEAEHAGAGDHDALARIELDEETRQKALALVREIFALFADWADEVLRYAEAQLGQTARVPRALQAAAAANSARLSGLRPAL